MSEGKYQTKDAATKYAMAGTCQGDCAECRGDIYVCFLSSVRVDFGWWAYCEAAIIEDISRGIALMADVEIENNVPLPVVYCRTPA